MQLILYQNNSPKNKIGKSLTQIEAMSGTLREASNLIDPTITIESDSITNVNYCFIPEFGRYYFIQDITIIRNDLIQLKLHVDVLESFANQIKAHSAIIGRQQNLYNMYLDDDQFKTYNNVRVQTLRYPGGFTNSLQHILITAGDGGD